MGELRARRAPDTLPAPMRVPPSPGRVRQLACSLLALALLLASSQFLAHFHVPQAAHALSAHADAADPADHGARGHCSLCLQFDRLPAPPAPLNAPQVYWSFIAIVEAERLQTLALDPLQLWPPSRGPPLLVS